MTPRILATALRYLEVTPHEAMSRREVLGSVLLICVAALVFLWVWSR